MIARSMMLFFRAERGGINREGKNAADKQVGQKAGHLKQTERSCSSGLLKDIFTPFRLDLEKTAIKRIQSASEMALNHYGKPLLVTDSGGKDSAVCRELVRRSGVPHEIIHNLTTADAPQTVLYIRERFREAEEAGIPCEIQYPYYKGKRVTMWSLIPQKKIPPTRLARYCCEVLKEGSGVGRFITTGVRWAESRKRKNGRGIYEAFDRNQAKKLILNNDNDDRRQLFESCRVRSKHICNPIVDWSDRDVWDYIQSEKIPVNPLYEMGFYRVGCIGCPMAGKHRYREFALFPTYERAYKRAFEKMLLVRKLEGKDDSTGGWVDAESVFRWWMEDNTMPGQYELQFDEDTNEVYY